MVAERGVGYRRDAGVEELEQEDTLEDAPVATGWRGQWHRAGSALWRCRVPGLHVAGGGVQGRPCWRVPLARRSATGRTQRGFADTAPPTFRSPWAALGAPYEADNPGPDVRAQDYCWVNVGWLSGSPRPGRRNRVPPCSWAWEAPLPMLALRGGFAEGGLPNRSLLGSRWWPATLGSYGNGWIPAPSPAVSCVSTHNHAHLVRRKYLARCYSCIAPPPARSRGPGDRR